MVAIKTNEDPLPWKRPISIYHGKLPDRSDMIINIVYNVLCTPLALGLLYYLSLADSLRNPASLEHPGKLLALSVFVLLASIWGSRLIIWAVLSILTILGLPITKEQNSMQMFKMPVVFLLIEPVIAVPRQPHLDEKAFESYKTWLRVLDVVAIVADIAICFAIYISSAFQHILSNMYNGYQFCTAGYMVMYVFGLTFWARQYIRAKVHARCGRHEACYCHPTAESER